MNTLKKFVRNVKSTVKFLFNIELTKTQRKIVEDILKKKHRRIIILAMTRYGKTFTIAIASILYAVLNPGSKIVIVAPRGDQGRILMDYVYNLLSESKHLKGLLPLSMKVEEDMLKKEFTKSRLTLLNKSEIRILSAHGKGEQLLGFGADLLIIDESCLIPDEVYRMMILRMLGENPDSILVEIGNPVKRNHFFDSWNDPKYKRYKIDWRVALEEGRVREEFIEEMRQKMTEVEFKIMYEAEFPDESENSLLSFSDIERAINQEEPEGEFVYEIGVDVARFGCDYTVITIIKNYDDEFYSIEDIIHFSKQDTMQTVGKIIELYNKYKPVSIKVDEIGIGAGVVDRLKEQGLPVRGFNAGRPAPKTFKGKRFQNLKSYVAWRLRELFKEGKIKIPRHKNLIDELVKIEYELTSTGKIKIKDPEDKSPDFFDSLLIAIWKPGMEGSIGYIPNLEGFI
ncbi:MAG: hypothetical protein DRN30_02885 [Thermoplasmata archaeon]|nr:MAG: hypothetical protein DRN30_02885 [Thermoplasmata archaeon]